MTELEALRELAQRQKQRLDEQEATLAVREQQLDNAAEALSREMAANVALRQQLAEAQIAEQQAKQEAQIAMFMLIRSSIGFAVQRMVA